MIYNGVAVDEFSESHVPPHQRSRPYVLALGRWVPQKGFDVLLRAFAFAAQCDNVFDHDLVLAGDGPERGALLAIVAEGHSEDRVHLFGMASRDEVVSLFKGCSYFALPSRYEPLGIVNLEAMAAGKAIVATRVGGVPELVADGEQGLLVEAENARQLADTLRRLAGDPVLRSALGSRGRATVADYSCRASPTNIWRFTMPPRIAYARKGVTNELAAGRDCRVRRLTVGLSRDRSRSLAGLGGSPGALRVLRIYHSGRDPQHRLRERALTDLGVDVTLVVPDEWPDAGSQQHLSSEPFRVIELPVRRVGDVNRHAYRDGSHLRRVIDEARPDVLDVHEEPFSTAGISGFAPRCDPVRFIMYSAQNIDKRFPPPYAFYERLARDRVAALYPCTAQAAAVLRGKGLFSGRIEILDLGYDDGLYRAGTQAVDPEVVMLAVVGRLVPEKGVVDAVQVLPGLTRPARKVGDLWPRTGGRLCCPRSRSNSGSLTA